MTGAALLPVGLWFTPDGGWGQQIMAPVGSSEGRLRDGVNGATQQLADAFATMIAEHPADWHMVQKLWLADLTPPKVPDGPGRRAAVS
jgi:phosphatidylinositol dimannoside acyltransferase